MSTDASTPNGSTPRAPTESDDLSAGDLIAMLRARWRLLVIAPLLAGLVALGATFLMPKIYTATSRILPPQQNQGLAAMLAQQFGGLAGLAGAAGGLKNPNDQFVAMLNSRTIADRIIRRFDLQRVYESEFQEDARKELADRSSIVAGRDGLIAVEVDDRDPARAAAIANAYVEELGKLMQGLAITEAAQRRLFFERKLGEAREQLAKSEAALGSSPVSERVLKAEPRAAAEMIARLRAEVTATEIAVSTMRGYLADGSPDLKVAQGRLSALRAQLAAAQQADVRPNDSERDGYVARYREFKYAEGLFELLAKQFELARIDEARDGALIQVIDQAVVPERNSKPYKALIAIACALAALVASLAWVLFGSADRVGGFR
jgi:tyrosine-protein kinase Etk/Wzc